MPALMSGSPRGSTPTFVRPPPPAKLKVPPTDLRDHVSAPMRRPPALVKGSGPMTASFTSSNGSSRAESPPRFRPPSPPPDRSQSAPLRRYSDSALITSPLGRRRPSINIDYAAAQERMVRAPIPENCVHVVADPSAELVTRGLTGKLALLELSRREGLTSKMTRYADPSPPLTPPPTDSPNKVFALW